MLFMVVFDLCVWVVLWLIIVLVILYIVDFGIVNKYCYKYLGGKINYLE